MWHAADDIIDTYESGTSKAGIQRRNNQTAEHAHGHDDAHRPCDGTTTTRLLLAFFPVFVHKASL